MMIKTVLAAAFLTGCIMPPVQSGQSTTPSSSSSAPADPEPASHASPAPANTSSSAPAAPTTVSVTIRSSCSKTAKVFYGDKPGFSSGTQSSVSSNSVSSKTFRVGDQMWVLDDAGKPLDNVRIESSTRQIEVSSSCSTLASR